MMLNRNITYSETPVKPFVKWVGGKTQLISSIKQALPKVEILTGDFEQTIHHATETNDIFDLYKYLKLAA